MARSGKQYWKWFPCVVTASSVVSDFEQVQCRLPGGRLVPARPLMRRRRWRAAWLVLTGRADALVWDGGQ
jgi:hypothetical protein